LAWALSHQDQLALAVWETDGSLAKVILPAPCSEFSRLRRLGYESLSAADSAGLLNKKKMGGMGGLGGLKGKRQDEILWRQHFRIQNL
jgi:hypothetical protein